MKRSIHPAYGPVVFRDTSNGSTFLTRSTLGGDPAGHAARQLVGPLARLHCGHEALRQEQCCDATAQRSLIAVRF